MWFKWITFFFFQKWTYVSIKTSSKRASSSKLSAGQQVNESMHRWIALKEQLTVTRKYFLMTVDLKWVHLKERIKCLLMLLSSCSGCLVVYRTRSGEVTAFLTCPVWRWDTGNVVLVSKVKGHPCFCLLQALQKLANQYLKREWPDTVSEEQADHR